MAFAKSDEKLLRDTALEVNQVTSVEGANMVNMSFESNYFPTALTGCVIKARELRNYTGL